MLSNRIVVVVVVSAACAATAACAVEEASNQQQGAARIPGTPPNEDPIEEPGEEPSEAPCASTPPKINGWKTYTNGHFSFQAPRGYFVDDGREVPVELLSEIRDNTDPAVSAAFAMTEVGHQPSAYWFAIRVTELHKSGTPSDGMAEFARFPPGLPPATREYNVCGLMEARATTYACEPAADAIIKCWTLRGYTHQAERFVYSGDRTFHMLCAGSGMTRDREEICAKALDTLIIRD